jgi:ABC-type phosphate transport system auxiliary subunit
MAITDDNGRVTLAVISNQIENIQEDVIEINGKIDNSNVTLNDLNVKTAVIEKGQKSICDDVDGLQEKSNRNDVLVVIGNLIVVAVASVANALGMRD